MVRPRKIGRPTTPGTAVYIRMRPELRERINAILAAEQPKIGKLSLNETINYLLNLGITKYSEIKRNNAKEKDSLS